MKKIERLYLGFLAIFLMKITLYGGPLNLYLRGVEGEKTAIATSRSEASGVGIDILNKGGNAVDAAVAASFAIGVLEPNSSGLGGGGIMIIDPINGKPVVIDFREQAPENSRPDMYKLDKNGKVIGNELKIRGKSVGIPGEVEGLLVALKKYGTLSREEVMEPAINLAYYGITVTENLASIIKDNYEKISKNPETAKVYLKNGKPYKVGEIIKNPDYGKILEKIAKKGPSAFYKGEVAKRIVNEVQKQGGIMTEKDLKNYSYQKLKPIVGTYRYEKILSVPSENSGGPYLIQLLNMMENFDLRLIGDNTYKSWHLWSEAMRQMYAERAKYMEDKEFKDTSLKTITSKEYAKKLVQKFNMKKPSENKTVKEPWKYRNEGATHISVIDGKGNMVSITKSINHFFGSGIVAPGTGIILNNSMDNFLEKSGSKNSIEPGKRPLTSMAPTIVIDQKGRPFIILGSSGGESIIPSIALVISNIIDYDMDLQSAIIAPRILQYQFGPLKIEGRVSTEAYKKLKEIGHEIEVKTYYSPYFGEVNGVMENYEDTSTLGGADPRRDGEAYGF